MRPWQTAPIHIGPAGWHRPEWGDLLAGGPARRGQHRLERLGGFTGLAEVTQTGEGPLRREIAALYAKKVESNRNFLFVAPLWRRFTHDRDLSPEAMAAFREGLRPLVEAKRLGALILEFPWAFRFTPENRAFLIELRRAFHEFPMAAEFRHDSWLRDEAFTTLVQYRLGFVNIDQPDYFGAMPPAALVTTSTAVVRLHGRAGREAFQEFGAATPPYLYTTEELEGWAPRLTQLAQTASRVLVSFTSGAQGRSLANALQLQEMMGSKDLRAPAGVLERFPGELAGFRPERPVQRALLGGEWLRPAA